MNSRYEDKEQTLGQMLLVGAGLFFFGLILTVFAIFLRSVILFAIGPLLAVLGMVLAGAGLLVGLGHNKTMASAVPRPQEEGRIVARYAINQIGEMIFDNFEYDAEEARFYVRVQYLDGRREELECGRPVFDQCGEGMRGLLLIQGNWLSSFSALPDTDETRAAYRGF